MTVPPQPAPRSRVADLISVPRLAPYLAAANGNQKDALRLYRWNLAVGGAVHEALSILEVMLRNAMDEQLSAWNATQTGPNGPHSPHWLIDPSRLLDRLSGTDITQANDRCANLGIANPTHNDLLAQTSFGTWRYLLWSRDAGTQYLWNGVLYAAFPHWQKRPQDLTARVVRIHQLRNRVAHLEPMLSNTTVTARVDDMEQVLAAIDPAAEAFFTGIQRVTGVLSRRPNFKG